MYHWEHYGIAKRDQSLDDVVAVDTVLQYVRSAPLTLDSASRIIDILKDRGLIESATLASDGPDTEPLTEFPERFWDYDKSPYVREKLAYNHSIGRRHCYEQTKRLHHWRAYFGADTRLRDVTRETLKAFQLYLRDKELAPKTVNAVVSVGTVSLAWATEQAILESNPAANLKKFSGKSKARGILTPQQANDLFSVSWPDERARVGNLVAMTTGLRAGEIVAIRAQDIGEDRLWVRHSWSFADGLKTPKNGEERIVPLLPSVRSELLKLAKANPHGPSGFLFYHADPDRPCDSEILRKGLKKALVDMSLSKKDRENEDKRTKAWEKWSAAGISFHSWRHFFAAHMADRVDMRSLQLATGHKSPTMAAHYAAHASDEHFKGVATAATAAFGQVVSSPEGA